jgi:hypothetical protein
VKRATITIHLPTHRQDCIRNYGPSWRLLDQVYDGRIADYVEFLQRQGRERGFRVRTDRHVDETAISIQTDSITAGAAANDWLDAVPDFWEWLH